MSVTIDVQILNVQVSRELIAVTIRRASSQSPGTFEFETVGVVKEYAVVFHVCKCVYLKKNIASWFYM